MDGLQEYDPYLPWVITELSQNICAVTLFTAAD